MRYVFLVILLFHGLIHLMGFSKAFGLVEIEQLSQAISKPKGLAWLLTSFLFMAAAFGYFAKKEWWPVLAVVSVVISQILIVIFWKDSKFGTLVNFIILTVALQVYGKYNFQKMTQTESMALLQGVNKESQGIVRKEDVENLPPIVQKWMELSGVVGKPKFYSVRLKQKGEMKTKPNGKWMRFTADQYFNAYNPSFVWVTNVKANALIYMDGRDKLENGQGQMLIKLNSLFPVVNEVGNEKVDSGTMQRYLAEMCWFPTAALMDYISWEVLDGNSAKAIMNVNGKEVSGIFNFRDNGQVISFKTERYYGGGEDAQLRTWIIEIHDFAIFEGVKIPSKCNVIWKLPEDDFNWLNLEITHLEYNVNQLW